MPSLKFAAERMETTAIELGWWFLIFLTTASIHWTGTGTGIIGVALVGHCMEKALYT
jgi:hypothetical protein